ncbi:MAG: HesA/MoeB/ThiF family protein [Desulfosudaceae bacterium]
MTGNDLHHLSAIVADQAEEIKDPAERTVRIIREAVAREVAGQAGVSLRRVYMAALRAGIWPLRYLRNSQSLSTQEQLRLARARVAIIGAGGLGATVAILLARMGVGSMTVVDADIFDESNLNRQLTAVSGTLGLGKAVTLKKDLLDINPAVEVRQVTERLTPENAATLLDQTDAVVDALDNVDDRLNLEKACQKALIPLIHGAVAGFEGQVMVVCPQKSGPGEPGLAGLYGRDDRFPAAADMPEARLGVPGVTPAVVAGLQATETVKVLLNRGRIIKNRLLYIDLEQGGFQELPLSSDSD